MLILTGQTASGKSTLAVDLALEFRAEIVNADSRQVYRGMTIGTAAPAAEQLAAVPHHLVGFLEPDERYSAARFVEDARLAIDEIHRRGKRAIVAGGTGFYVRALTGAVQLAEQYDPQLRERLATEARIHGAAFLHEWLRVLDPKRAAMLHAADSYRVVRALEVALARRRQGLPPLHLRPLQAQGISTLKVLLTIDPAELDRRIEERTDDMLERGLIEEAECIGAKAVAASAVGYPQALAYLHGWSTYAEMRLLLIRATRRYAKRQASWFANEPDTIAAPPSAVAQLAREMLGWV